MYRIPAGALDGAVASFAATAGISLSFESGVLAGKRTRGLEGGFTPQDGLNRLLEEAGLEGVPQAGGVYSIRVRSAPPLPPVPVRARQEAVAETQLPAISVVTDRNAATFGYQDGGFTAANTRSATRTDTALSDVPQAIQIVTQEVLKSQQAQSISEVLRNVSAVGDGGYNRITVRGFDAPILENGLKFSGLLSGSNDLGGLSTPMAAVERVEVLKGADSIIAGGEMQPGGIVNIVSKRPQAERVRDLTWEVDDHGQQLASLDVAGALVEDKALTYRVILSGRYDARSDAGYVGGREVYLAPSLGWRREGTSLVVGMAYQRWRVPSLARQYANLTPRGPGPDLVHDVRGHPDDGDRNRTATLFYDLEQHLWGAWTLFSKFRYQRRDLGIARYDLQSNPAVQTGGTVSPYGMFSQYFNWRFENGIRGRFKTGALDHTLLAGLTSSRDWSGTNFLRYTVFPTLEVGPDGFRSLPPVNSLLYGRNFSPFTRFSETVNNVFLQDQIAWDRWHVLANVGYTRVKSPNFHTATDASGQTQDISPPQNKPVYNFGVAYRLNDSATVYANALSSFTAGGTLLNATLDGGERGRVTAPPAEGKSAEIGLKLNLLDDRLAVTGNLFRATHTNVLKDVTLDPLSASHDFVLLPSTLSRGVEFNVGGRLSPGWNLLASYSYTRFEFAKPPKGSPELSRVPRHKLSLWTTYDLQGEALRGWGIGAGVTMRSGYKASTLSNDQGNSTIYRLGAQAQVDASIYYQSKTWSATLGIKNLFNRRLFADYASSSDVGVLPYRTILLTGTYSF